MKEPIKDSIRRYYFHLSTKDLHVGRKKTDGSKNPEAPFVLRPLRGDTDNRIDSEPDIPRTCVAHSIINCLIAIPAFIDLTYTYNIYRTTKRIASHIPYDVIDSEITCERWLLSPTEFQWLGIWDMSNTYVFENLDLSLYFNSLVGDKKSIPKQKKSLKAWKELLSRKNFNKLSGVIFFKQGFRQKYAHYDI